MGFGYFKLHSLGERSSIAGLKALEQFGYWRDLLLRAAALSDEVDRKHTNNQTIEYVVPVSLGRSGHDSRAALRRSVSPVQNR
jgi:hypothetical protein